MSLCPKRTHTKIQLAIQFYGSHFLNQKIIIMFSSVSNLEVTIKLYGNTASQTQFMTKVVSIILLLVKTIYPRE